MWKCSVLFVIAAACGGGRSSPDAFPDASPEHLDAGVQIDAFSCTSCVAPVAICDTANHRCDQCAGPSDCASLAYTNVCADGACVECAGTSDCTASSLGPTCNAGQCQCAAPSDCAGNANGSVCDPDLHACICTGDADCATGTCQPQPYLGPGAKTCQ